jgi:DNA (cytosine-5)-methyltransferase 1
MFREGGGYADAIARWEHITGRPAPAPALLTVDSMPRPAAPEFVEWFMGLPTGWVTDDQLGLTSNEQITALGNGVLPIQALSALSMAPKKTYRLTSRSSFQPSFQLRRSR